MEGRITLNDNPVDHLGCQVNPDQDKVALDGNLISIPKRYRYVLLNKPAGTITSAIDGRGRITVMDVIEAKERLFPVGRLDYDTTGVLLLTNDGDLAHRLAHPRFEVEKIYRAWAEGEIEQQTIERLKAGVEIEAGMVVSGESRILQKKNGKTLVEIQVHEGKKRQIKRMLKSVGHPVIQLTRLNFAGLTVDDLKEGEQRDLTESEVQELYHKVGLNKKNTKH